MLKGGHEKIAALSAQNRAIAAFMKVAFFDAGSVISNDGSDGIHFTAQNNRDLGKALAAKVIDILGH